MFDYENATNRNYYYYIDKCMRTRYQVIMIIRIRDEIIIFIHDMSEKKDCEVDCTLSLLSKTIEHFITVVRYKFPHLETENRRIFCKLELQALVG